MSPSEAPCETTVYLLRHAEKDMGENPPLTPAGAARARGLAALLKDVHLVAVYSTDTRRTRATIEPLARAQGLPVLPYEARQSEDVVRAAMVQHRCQGFLVVGHSNTLPALMRGTDAPAIEELDERRYGDLFIVRQTAAGITRENRTFDALDGE